MTGKVRSIVTRKYQVKIITFLISLTILPVGCMQKTKSDGSLLHESGLIDKEYYEDINVDISGQQSIRLYLRPTNGYGCYIIIKYLNAY